ncbi:thioredoxin family protein (plasmid) [Lactobacillus sp. ESL0731]|uniref:thioredoxin family protein n=1 Tax=unclassified Lactobacillus TaxID=2620435 RepID=UPI0023F9F4D7|nr:MULTISPECIES: thioredoxin family protein [unclassified Lactobacillus]WEV52107.1 thioredoxin family protein [Lactobacillus sp. ESL0700]WEV63260.1 thioredoxin family protein [Lactobacillus sp. ESL0731]
MNPRLRQQREAEKRDRKKRLKHNLFKKIGKRLAILVSLFFMLFIGISIENSHINQTRTNRSAVRIKRKNSILFFYRDDCADCKKVFPLISIMHDLGSPIQFINTKNALNHEKSIVEFHIKTVPTLILIDNSGTEINRYSGSNIKNIKTFIKNNKVGEQH